MSSSNSAFEILIEKFTVQKISSKGVISLDGFLFQIV